LNLPDLSQGQQGAQQNKSIKMATHTHTHTQACFIQRHTA